MYSASRSAFVPCPDVNCFTSAPSCIPEDKKCLLNFMLYQMILSSSLKMTTGKGNSLSPSPSCPILTLLLNRLTAVSIFLNDMSLNTTLIITISAVKISPTTATVLLYISIIRLRVIHTTAAGIVIGYVINSFLKEVYSFPSIFFFIIKTPYFIWNL